MRIRKSVDQQPAIPIPVRDGSRKKASVTAGLKITVHGQSLARTEHGPGVCCAVALRPQRKASCVGPTVLASIIGESRRHATGIRREPCECGPSGIRTRDEESPAPTESVNRAGWFAECGQPLAIGKRASLEIGHQAHINRGGLKECRPKNLCFSRWGRCCCARRCCR